MLSRLRSYSCIRGVRVVTFYYLLRRTMQRQTRTHFSSQYLFVLIFRQPLRRAATHGMHVSSDATRLRICIILNIAITTSATDARRTPISSRSLNPRDTVAHVLAYVYTYTRIHTYIHTYIYVRFGSRVSAAWLSSFCNGCRRQVSLKLDVTTLILIPWGAMERAGLGCELVAESSRPGARG